MEIYNQKTSCSLDKINSYGLSFLENHADERKGPGKSIKKNGKKMLSTLLLVGLTGSVSLGVIGCKKHNDTLLPTPQMVTIITKNFFESGLTEGNLKYHLEGVNSVYEGVINNGFSQRNDVLTGEYTLILNYNGTNGKYIMSIRKIEVSDKEENRFEFRIPKLEELLSGRGQDGKIYTITPRDWYRLYTPEGHYGRLVDIEDYYYWPKDMPQKYPRVWQRLLEWSNDARNATQGDINPDWKPYPKDTYQGGIANSLTCKVDTSNSSSGWSGYTHNKSTIIVDFSGSRLASEATDCLLPGDNEARWVGWASCLAAAERMTELDKKAVRFIYSRTRNGRKWDVYVVGNNIKEVQK